MKDVTKFLTAVSNAKDVPEAVAITIGDHKDKILKQTDAEGNTALHLAARNGNVKLVLAILKKTEAFIDSQNLKGQTPRDLAAEGNHGRVIDALEKPAKDAAAKAAASAAQDVASSSKSAAVSSSKGAAPRATSSNTHAARLAEKAIAEAAVKAKLSEKASAKAGWGEYIKSFMPCGSGKGRS